MAKQGGIKDVAVGRSDFYQMDPADLHIKDGWNCRNLDTVEARASLDSLALSIAEVGVKQALTVCWEDGKAFVTDGHRRLLATRLAMERGAEIRSIPVQTEGRFSSEADRVFSMVVRNSGEPLLPIEMARVFKRLIDFGWTESEIASKAGLNRQYVVSLLQLQAAPSQVTDLVDKGEVAATLAVSVMKANKGDMTATAETLNKAVETAKAAGKARATAKHVETTDRKPKGPGKVATFLLANSSVDTGDDESAVYLRMDIARYREFCAMLDIDERLPSDGDEM
ncbi:plasmid partitioning protein [Hartmannibacter diazotrophicus]|uniref:Plasmid partitioning protein n=1 Tax=Hartmannibacter diazotrophicus TaxID=1482074 RepID=A0A2C9D2B9_9HYPH|nr:ParB N-terminal domain-containing protein [Hartmannibacter diazotrophicus]SON54298.1 plasmid partitioning protein [Hartmannibacter diazotrophicus]